MKARHKSALKDVSLAEAHKDEEEHLGRRTSVKDRRMITIAKINFTDQHLSDALSNLTIVLSQC